MPQNEKNLILNFGKPRKDKDYHKKECTFSPKINQARKNSKSSLMRSSMLSPKSVVSQSSAFGMITPQAGTVDFFPQERQVQQKLSGMSNEPSKYS